MLRALAAVAAKGAARNKPVTLCGEMGGKPLEAMALVALGYRGLSMVPSSIGPVKAMVLALDVAETARFLRELMAAGDGKSIRAQLRAFAEDHAVPV
jgi:phosphotransferase system, enzyme I, PtsP